MTKVKGSVVHLLNHSFVAKVRTSPLGITELARRAGLSRFWLSRLLSYADAVAARDTRIVKVGKMVGLRPDQIFVERDAM